MQDVLYILLKKTNIQSFASIYLFVFLTYIKLLILFMLPSHANFIHAVSYLTCSRYFNIQQLWHVWHVIIPPLSPSKIGG